MGSRGSDYNDDSIKKSKSISKAEQRIEAEGTKFPNMPGRGLQESLYKSRAERSLEIMNIAKDTANLNRLDNSIKRRDNLLKDLISGSLKQKNGKLVADGGLLVNENSPKTNLFVYKLGYTSVNDISQIVIGQLDKDKIFNMKNSDKYFATINNKKEYAQIYEFELEISPKNGGTPVKTYVKLINVHGNNGAIYSVIDSIHEPERDIHYIWPQN